MFYNYLKITFRNLFKYESFSLINLLGLTIGISAFILLMQYVSFELSYDTFQEKGENIFRVQANQYNEGKLEIENAFTAPALGPTVEKNLPEVNTSFRLTSWAENYTVLIEDEQQTINTFKEEKAIFADPYFLQAFDFEFLLNSHNKMLTKPGTALISETLANKYFGNKWTEVVRPQETFITVYNSNRDQSVDFLIEGVYQDMPINSHLNYDLIFSHNTLPFFLPAEIPDQQRLTMFENSWGPNAWYTYLVLTEGTNPDTVENKVNRLMADLLPAEAGNQTENLLQPISEIHLKSNLANEPGTLGNENWVVIMLVIGLLIIGIAWINYVNLNSVKALDRVREISLRKVSGASRSNVIIQFVLEAAFYNLIAFMLALIITQLTVPYFSDLVGVKINLLKNYALHPILYLSLFLVAGVIVTGVYPIYALLGINPAQILKGKFRSKPKGIKMRQSLVIIQFATSLALTIGTIVIYKQVEFMRNRDVGFESDQILVIEGPNVLEQEVDFPQTVAQLEVSLSAFNSIKQVSASSAIPGSPTLLTRNMQRQDRQESGFKPLHEVQVNENYIPLLDLNILAGRNFSANAEANRQKMLINEAALEFYGFDSPESAIGKSLGMQNWGGISEYEIIGIVENYHQRGLKNDFQPTGFFYEMYSGEYLVKLAGSQNFGISIDLVRDQWQRLFPNNPFQYYFLDEYFNRQYQADQRFGKIFSLFAGLAIFIASMGLFGLTAFYAFQKAQEISIRKILGASVSSIIQLLSKEFITLILISGTLAIPLAYLVMQDWLDNYAFRIEISWWMLFFPVALILLITVLTMAYQTTKAALKNPVEVLRYE